VVEKLGADLGTRAVIAHLGGGSSLVALGNGAPVDTTMGLTPSGGVMMATRTGDLDPGVIFHLLEGGMTSAQVERLVNRDGGLLAVSGESADMKVLLARSATDARARLAIEMYCYQIKKQIGAFAAALGGLDTLVFTGGIGEHAAPVRQAICAGLEHLGLEIDPARNAQGASVFSREGSRVTARVVPTNEQLMIARRTRRVLSL
jgi:acetate kinase